MRGCIHNNSHTHGANCTRATSERPFAEHRRRAGLDLYRAAIRLNVHPRYLRSLELSRGPLSFELARRMAAEYGVTVNDLVRKSC